MGAALESTDVKNKLKDLSGVKIQPGENPYKALIEACDDDSVCDDGEISRGRIHGLEGLWDSAAHVGLRGIPTCDFSLSRLRILKTQLLIKVKRPRSNLCTRLIE